MGNDRKSTRSDRHRRIAADFLTFWVWRGAVFRRPASGSCIVGEPHGPVLPSPSCAAEAVLVHGGSRLQLSLRRPRCSGRSGGSTRCENGHVGCAAHPCRTRRMLDRFSFEKVDLDPPPRLARALLRATRRATVDPAAGRSDVGSLVLRASLKASRGLAPVACRTRGEKEGDKDTAVQRCDVRERSDRLGVDFDFPHQRAGGAGRPHHPRPRHWGLRVGGPRGTLASSSPVRTFAVPRSRDRGGACQSLLPGARQLGDLLHRVPESWASTGVDLLGFLEARIRATASSHEGTPLDRPAPWRTYLLLRAWSRAGWGSERQRVRAAAPSAGGRRVGACLHGGRRADSVPY